MGEGEEGVVWSKNCAPLCSLFGGLGSATPLGCRVLGPSSSSGGPPLASGTGAVIVLPTQGHASQAAGC